MANKTFAAPVRSTLFQSFICLTSLWGLCAGTAWLSSAAESLQPLSLRHPGAPSAAGAGGDSYAPLLSPDGRYLLFASTAQNLALATNGLPFQGAARPVLNVYWRDRLEQRTVLVTHGLSGTEVGNSNSLPAALSTNGLLALVESTASNLVPNDTNSVSDIFLFDLEHGQTVLVSAATNGLPGNGASSHPVMSADGRYVAFASLASNLVENDTNNVSDIFLRDLQSGLTLLVSTNVQVSSPPYPYVGSDLPQITPDGRKVAFVVVTNSQITLKLPASIRVRDLVNGSTVWASSEAAAALGLPSTSEASCFSPAFSDDGAFLAYEATPSGTTASAAALLRYNLNTGTTEVIHTNVPVPSIVLDDVQNVELSADGQRVAFLANTNGADSCVLVWDASSGVCTLASANLTNGLSTAASCLAPRLDPQGRWVSFLSSATDLVTNTLSGDYHLYQRDLLTGTTTLLDVDENGASWPLTSLSVPVLSADGRYVAFECVRPQISGNQNSDIFVLDRQSGGSELVSRHAPELPSATANGVVLPASISADGRVVAFASDAEDLAPNDGNGVRDVFVRDLLAATNLLVSANLEARSGNGPSFAPVVSGNGRYVAFSSVANDLVSGDNNSVQDVFVRDLQSAQTVLASRAWNGASANSNSSPVSVSDDGRYVLFRSFASNLAQGYFIGEHLFLRDMQQGTNFAITSGGSGFSLGGTDLTPNGRFAAYSFQANYSSFNTYVSVWDTELKRTVFSNVISSVTPQVAIAPDGSQFAWISNSAPGFCTVLQSLAAGTRTVLGGTSNMWIRPRFSGDSRWLVFGAMAQGTYQLYLRDLVNGTNLLVSRRASAGVPAAGDSDSPALSQDGRFVVYRSFASDIVPGDTNGAPDIFLFDRVTASTLLLSVNRDGASAANGRSGSPGFSADGQTIVFCSWASNLTPLDFNAKPDLFAYKLSSSGVSFYVQALLAGGVPTLLWPAEPGKTYRVQFKDDLQPTGWQDAPGTITIRGSQCSYSDPAPSAKRFFRVVAE
jgi:Tol biopolymer transport system component